MCPRKRTPDGFSRRERQIIEILYRRGEAGAAEVLEDMPDPPGYSAVRATLRIMEEKGHLLHRTEGTRYLYRPVRSRPKGDTVLAAYSFEHATRDLTRCATSERALAEHRLRDHFKSRRRKR